MVSIQTELLIKPDSWILCIIYFMKVFSDLKKTLRGKSLKDIFDISLDSAISA
jgi:hypothetical protein